MQAWGKRVTDVIEYIREQIISGVPKNEMSYRGSCAPPRQPLPYKRMGKSQPFFAGNLH